MDGAQFCNNYTGNQTTVKDPAGANRALTADAAGRVTQVVEDPGASNYVTNYTYDGLDHLTTVTQLNTMTQLAQVRTFKYDPIGRLYNATNPENGLTQYSYDNNGNLIGRTDNRNITTNYYYDGLNRLTQVNYTGNAAPNVTYSYDTGAAYAKTRLVSVNNGSVTDTITGYDALGRITGSSEAVAGNGTYAFPNYSYNLADALTSETYPTGRVITNGYDGANRISSVTGSLGGTPKQYVTNLSYAPHGGPSSYTYGNGLARQYYYNTRLQPMETKDYNNTNNIANPVLDLQFGYGGSTNNGNLQWHSISGIAGNFYQSFGYDKLNRLQAAGENNTSNNPNTFDWSQTFGYDQYGNMWLNSISGLQYQPMMPSNQNAINESNNHLVAQSYDGAGNQTTMGFGTGITYDAENRQTSFAGTTYTYDGLGQRVSKTLSGGGTTIYAWDAFGNLAAEYGPTLSPPCTTCYVSFDHLGSTRMVTDQNGTLQSRHDYEPFGLEIPNGYASRTGVEGKVDGLNPMFTGQARDTESGLDYFNARYMGNQEGRFTSADPLGIFLADPTNPQSWNLYSYVRNNPLSLIDPSGLDGCDPFDDDGGGVFCDDPGFGGGWGGGWPEPPTGLGPPSASPPVGSYPNQDQNSGAYGNNVLPGMSGSAQTLWDYFGSYLSTLGFLGNFLTGTGPTNRFYGPRDYRTRDLMSSGGFQAINQQIRLACQAGKNSGNINLSTPGAAQEIPYDVAHSPVGGQVGGYNGSWTISGNTVTVTVANEAGLHSFLYHIPPNVPWSRGPGRTIHQTFVIKEPSPCGGG